MNWQLAGQVRNTMTEAVLFDLGDTLLDFDPMPRRELFESAARATYEHLKSRNCRLPQFSKYFALHIRAVRWAYIWASLRGREIDSFRALQKWCTSQGYPNDEESIRELIWMWYQPVIPRSRVAPDVIPALRQLQADGLGLALVSNTLLPGCVLDRHLEMVGLKQFFPIRIYSSEVGYRKPRKIIFHAALGALKLPPESCLFVGDLVKTDIKGARRVGMTTVLRKTPKRQNTALADHIIDRIGDLPPLVRRLRGSLDAGAPVV
jgi:HAD superfamily hydrolase (TIGR01509 family)